VAKRIAELWAADVEAAGELSEPPQPRHGEMVGAFVEQAVAVLRDTASTARFDTEDATLDARSDLVNARDPRPGVGVRTVVNGAWMERVLRGWEVGEITAEIGERAWRWCRHLVDNPPGDGRSP
jgi:hypothetical protein